MKHKQDALHLQRNAVNSTVETSLASEGMDSGWSRRRLHWWIASSSLMIAGRPVPYAILKTRQRTVTMLQGRSVSHTDVPSNITELRISARIMATKKRYPPQTKLWSVPLMSSPAPAPPSIFLAPYQFSKGG